MPDPKKIILLTLGEELLLGLTANGHLTYIGNELRKAGATLHANATISDHPDDIASYFEAFWSKADVLITTGGLGPTVDDRTKEIIANCLGQQLVFDPNTMAAIESRFQKLGLALTENNRKQAYHFADADVLENPNGTAPGLWLEQKDKILIMLPGPPHELQPMFENLVMPRLRARSIVANKSTYIQIRTTGIGESALETMLQPIASREPDLDLAYCAHPGMVDFRMSLPPSKNSEERLLAISKECEELLGENFLVYGDETLTEIVSRHLKQKSQTLATAESCTGGFLSNEITNLPGASEFFIGGLVTYSEFSKQAVLDVPETSIHKNGVVSEAVAREMANGAASKLSADYAISTTGYIGPGGGTETEPVGTVYIGIRTPRHSFAKRHTFRGSRLVMKKRILNAAFDLLRKEIAFEAEPNRDDPIEESVVH